MSDTPTSPLPHDPAWWADFTARSRAPAEPDGHDPLACGLLGEHDLCAACRAAAEREADSGDAKALARAASLLRADLLRIAERFKAARDAAWRACVAQDQGACDAAEGERQEAAGEFYAARLALADLGLLLLRQALDHRPEALSMYLAEALAGELRPLAAAIAEIQEDR